MNQNSIQTAIAGVMPIVRASGLLVSLATFQSPVGATTEDPAGNLDDSGFPVGVYEDVLGLVDIRSMFATTSTGGGVAANETKGLQEQKADAPKILVLDRLYPSAVNGWRNGWRVVVDGIVYDLMGVENDSQAQYTHCLVRSLTE